MIIDLIFKLLYHLSIPIESEVDILCQKTIRKCWKI
nr:MAG TPA: hypothetical protein [Caudoviricetes sp.]